MKPKAKPKIAALALAAALAMPITAPITAPTVQASGIPTVDIAAIAQAILTVMESIQQTTALMDQYQTQLEQYENQLKNSMLPPRYLWDEADSTINKLIALQGTLAHYQRQLGGLQEYMDLFQTEANYKSNPCFNGTQSCSPADWQAIQKQDQLINESQKSANNDWLKMVNEQQNRLKHDAARLSQLQTNAQTATGQMEALSYANQFASQQNHLLMQMHTTLLAQQQALAIAQSKQHSLEERDRTAIKQMTGSTFTLSSQKSK